MVLDHLTLYEPYSSQSTSVFRNSRTHTRLTKDPELSQALLPPCRCLITIVSPISNHEPLHKFVKSRSDGLPEFRIPDIHAHFLNWDDLTILRSQPEFSVTVKDDRNRLNSSMEHVTLLEKRKSPKANKRQWRTGHGSYESQAV